VRACLYAGPTGECVHCGGASDPDRPDRFCSDDCAAGYDDHVAEQARARQQQRDREDAFAAACDHLRGKGYTDPEVDTLLGDWPT
jgi:hypothetical protein